ncbi:hypothetical protein FHW12_000083 [Dokdonella fugitiva]|uniref:Delta-60 repeat protein n=1 Tax=Dokdonella fugitiva TaxID=328517 RepID=A0A839EVT5_9GAMM|nr:delta-60 repeat domain-containing protein [Dokdonella fugitiva]MBA8885892.1 hypothetical protein [Dokdonella fugitiva]
MFALVAGFTGFGASAQVPLPDPDLDLIGNGRVTAMLRQADGSLIVGGEFQSINGVPRRNLARLLPDRTLDTAWDPSPDSAVAALAQAPGGGIYVGGYFNHIGSLERPGLARLDGAAGSVDAWVPVIGGAISIAVDADGSVFAVPFQSSSGSIVKLSAVDGTVLPWAAAFEQADYLALDGQGALYAAARQFDSHYPDPTFRATITRRVASTGELDGQWSADLTGPMDSSLDALLVDGDAVYVGGSFGLRKFSRATGEDVAGWNAPSARIAAIAADTAGHLFVGGSFESIHGQPRAHLARLSATTGLPSPGWTPSADGSVGPISVDGDGNVDIAGGFQSIDEEQRVGLGRLLADTTLSPARNDVEAPAKAFVLAAQDDGGMIVGGSFHRAGASAHRNILRLDANGVLDDAWNPSLPSMPWVLAAAHDGTIYAAMNRWVGDAHDVLQASRLARIDGNGHLDAGWSTAADSWIEVLDVASDGSLFAGGAFSTIGGLSRQALAKIDAKSGVPLPAWDAHLDCCSVEAIESGEGDDVFVGGTFTSVDGAARGGLAKLSAESATVDSQWAPDMAGSHVHAIALDHAGALYAGGQLAPVNGERHPLLVKLRADGSGENIPGWHSNFCGGPIPNMLYYAVWGLAIDSNGNLYASGFFCANPFPFTNERGLARLNGQNGLIDVDWNPLGSYEGPVYVEASTSGSIYAAGSFEHAGGMPRGGLAAFAPTLPDRLFANDFDEPLW